MAEPKKRCLYEILNVPRDCSQEEIRSAYKRLALQLHPDKLAQSTGNPSSAAATATAAFQELVHAYEVLSDPKERQWYDSHRSQILFSDPSKSHNFSSFDVDIFSFFSNSAFSGFSDTGKGFFKVYGDLFSKIYAQELYFLKELGLGQDSVAPAPLIGNLDSPYSQVIAFYNYWFGFCTVLDFGWVDEFDVSLGPNRRSRRAMEEENKKKRKKARREYNDLVRDLAAFVKKRDKRVRDMQLKKNLDEEKRREEEKVKKKEEERRKMERARLYEEPEWAKIDDEEEEKIFDEMGVDDDNGKKKGKGGEEFYCVVCNKKFKSDKQWKNHEQSKKHREKVAELRVSFQEEEEEEVLEDGGKEGISVGFDYEPHKTVGSDVVDELSEDLRDDLELREEGIEDGDLERSEKNLDSDDEASILEAMLSGHKSRKNDYLGHNDSSLKKVSHTNNDEKSSMEYDTRRSHGNRAARGGTDAKHVAEVVREETSGSRKDASEVQKQEDNVEELKEGTSCSFEGVAAKGKGDQVVGKNRKHKKQQVDGRGPAQKDTNVSKNSSKGRKQKATSKASGNACDTCGESFDSRNKLFAHLGDTGHAMLKSR